MTNKKRLITYVILIHVILLFFFQINIKKNNTTKKKIVVHTKIQEIKPLQKPITVIQPTPKLTPVKEKNVKKKTKKKPTKAKKKKKRSLPKQVVKQIEQPKPQRKKEITPPISEIVTREKLIHIIEVLQTHLVLPTHGSTTLSISINHQGIIDSLKPERYENEENLHYLLNLVPQLPLIWPNETYNTTFTFTFEG